MVITFIKGYQENQCQRLSLIRLLQRSMDRNF
nr:MAG TPA: hypothetical protein [Caudoviricetes sp.]